MIYALDKSMPDNVPRPEERIEAFPKGRATCPSCGGSVIAKCGKIYTHHWAHETSDCDTFSEPETAWHKEWKEEFPKSCREVVMGSHRADVKTSSCVIEFQHSSISQEDIADRESFYPNMIWVVDAKSFKMVFQQRGGINTFRWRWPRKSWWGSAKEKYFDMGSGWLFHMKKIYDDVPCGGWGKWITNEAFLQRVK